MLWRGVSAFDRRVCALAFTLLLGLGVASCGKGSQPISPSSAVQVKVGDAAADRILAFELTLKSLLLTTSNGQQITALTAARRIEFTRLAGTLEPVALLDIPQATYTEAAVTGGDLHLTYIDGSGAIHEYTRAGDINTRVILDPALTIAASSVVKIDLNLAASVVNIDLTNSQPPQFNPVYTFAVSPVSSTQQNEENGALEHVVGTATAADSSSFSMVLGQNGVPLDFLVDASTSFQDVTVTTLPNMIVEVDAVTGAEGSLAAERVTGLTSSNGAVVEGILTAAPYYEFLTLGAVVPSRRASTEGALVVQDGVGNGMVNALVGTAVTVDFSNASYGVNGEGMPDGWAFNLIGGLVFNSNTMAPGQSVQIVSDTGITAIPGGHTIPARTVTLQEQAASGVVSDYRTDFNLSVVYLSGNKKSVEARSAVSMPVAAFDLLLPEDSYLRQLNSATSISVGIFPETKVVGTSSLANGMSVRARGWLFYLGEEWLMVADRVDFVAAPMPTNAAITVARP